MKCRKLESRRAHRRILLQRLVVAILLTFTAGGVSANHPGGDHNTGKPSSKASLLALTTCALDLAGTDPAIGPALVVETTLTNKSTSGTVPEVRGGTISGTYKQTVEPGGAIFTLGDKAIGDLVALPAIVDPTLTITARFPLCDGKAVRTEVAGARELNGKSIVDYGIADAGGETRTLESRCKDDPNAPDGKGGIKVASVIDDIEAACTAQ